ncbi:MAG TPA: tRNA (adenosine(37)-N6)-dimethylallyltransferase MiaA [Bacteroidales bacterium]|jgi:tRNA dimethylallyltransferase|nr:tRNA (adenosine(37)-N6)-dimethylallyltransferase MiaA [Bacteroidales bacterium]
MNKTLIVLLGPTAVGKTDISIDIAQHLNCDIISADSRQFFREMKIGTARPSDDQLARVKHHFIAFLSVRDYYSSNRYEKDVLDLLSELFQNNNIALMSGGSAMYIDSVCQGIDDIPDADPAVREQLNRKYEEEGIRGLRIMLKILDPEYYKNVDLKNYKRIIRALEICETTGLPYSSFLKKQRRERDFNILKIGLERPREELYERIDRRVDEMIVQGLENEVASLYEYKEMNALNSVGYKEFFDYFGGRITKEKAIELIKRNTRRFAKRQITWWAKDKDISWFQADDIRGIIEFLDNNSDVRPK